MTLRRAVERRLGPFVVLLARLPRAVPFVVVAVLLVGGLLVQGATGGVLLLLLSGFLGALLFLGWPALQPGARAVRLALVAVFVARALSFLL